MPTYKDPETKQWYASFYYTDWQGHRKKKKKRGFATQREAKEFERNFLQQTAGTCNMLFSQMAEIYLEDIKTHFKPTTYHTATVLFKIYLPAFGDMPINSITPATIRAWQNDLVSGQKKYSQTYLRALCSRLSALFNFAIKYYNLKSNPMKAAGPIGKLKRDTVTFWTQEEFNRFITTFEEDNPHRVAFYLLFYSGIREGELLALTPTDIDFDTNTLSINKTYYRIQGKPIIQSPKTAKGNRKVVIPEKITKMLKNFCQSRYGLATTDSIFCIISKYSLTRAMKKYSALAGVPTIRIHDLRHSHASLLIHLGVSPILIKERLGHEDIQTTMQIYSHIYPNQDKAVLEKLNSLIK